MTLTEQWKKGELEDDYYYVRFKLKQDSYISIVECEGGEFGYYPDEDIKEVLAPVPSYEEWKELKEYEHIVTSYNMKLMDYDIACETVNKLLDEKTLLKAEIIQLKKKLESDFQKADAREYELATKFNNLYTENQQLKELLRECKGMIIEEQAFVEEDVYIVNKDEKIDIPTLLTKIDNAIGEKK